MMSWDELVGDYWILWAVYIVFVALVTVVVLYKVVDVEEMIYAVWPSLRVGAMPPPLPPPPPPPPPLSIEEVLERIPDVPYQELPGGAAAADDDDRETCVICVAPYEPGEVCGVLPGCGHVFHKLCAAKWLRLKSTCPLCRAAFAMTAADARQTDAVSAAENMVDEMRMWGSYSSSIQRASRVVWLGSLVYFNIMSPGWKVVFSILWILCATKLLQRIIFTEVEKRSYPDDKSWLISSYMDVMLERWPRRRQILPGVERLKSCKYIVMGEEKLVGLFTAEGYNTLDPRRPSVEEVQVHCDAGIITVGKVWQLADTDTVFNRLDSDKSIRRVCLSFALFKLLRRKFEHLSAMTSEEFNSGRELFSSVGLSDDDGEVVGALFTVMADEVKFLCEDDHSVVPIVLASPLFVLVNYFLVPVAVLALCIIAVAICGRGDVSHAVSSMSADNYALQPGFAKLAICALVRAGHSRPAFLFTLDLLVTLLLFIIFFDEIWEFLAVLVSNWFIISMVCNYMNKPNWRTSTVISSTFRWTLWLRRKMSKYTNIRLKQFSLLSPPLIAALVPDTLYLNVTSVPMTSYPKQSIGKILVQICSRFSLWSDDLPQYFPWPSNSRRESDTEVILTWHIAHAY